jgi:hypothetical protein
MSIQKNASFTASIQCLCAALLVTGWLGGGPAAAQSPADCVPTATAGDTFPLTLDTSVVSAKGTDEWNSDVIRISVREPGVLVVSAEGPEVQGLVYTPGTAGGEPRLLDEERIGSAGRILALAVDQGEYCLLVAPFTSGSGSLRVRADLIGLTVSNPE